MAYSQGDLILDDHYNIFATGNAAGSGDNSVANLNTVWGAGTTDKGYGQTNTLSAVSAGSSITATQWATLFTRITSAANHQGTTITALTNPSAGDSIDAVSTLSSAITSIYNNRGNAAASGTDSTTNTDGTGTWYTTTTHTITVTFTSDAKARYFFNAGGLIGISSSRSGGTSNDKNTEWTDTCTKIGTIWISGGTSTQTINGASYTGTTKSGGGGTVDTLNSNFGFHDSGTSNTTIFKQFADTGPYTANYIQIDLKDDGAGVITITVTYKDDATDTIIAPDGSDVSSFDRVDGTLRTTTTVRPPSTTYISDTWGTPTVSGSNSQS